MRGVICALLASIAYSVTFGAVHTHFGEKPESEQHYVLELFHQTCVSPGLPQSTASESHGCLICLLRQHLFDCGINTSYFSVSPEEVVLTSSDLVIPRRPRPVSNKPITPRSGRAPPLN